MFNGTQGSWIVPGALKEEHDAVHAWAKENLSESKVRKFQVVTGEGDTDLTESVSESITVQLEAISKELEGWNEKEKGLRPKTIANRIERLSKLQAQAEIYENALNFKMNGVNETLSAKKAEILELLNSLNEKEAA
jgi:primosomal protein N''